MRRMVRYKSADGVNRFGVMRLKIVSVYLFSQKNKKQGHQLIMRRRKAFGILKSEEKVRNSCFGEWESELAGLIGFLSRV